LSLFTPLQAHSGSTSIQVATLTVNLGTRRRWVVNLTPRPLYPQERTPVPTEQKTGWTPDPVSTVVGKKKVSCPCPNFETLVNSEMFQATTWHFANTNFSHVARTSNAIEISAGMIGNGTSGCWSDVWRLSRYPAQNGKRHDPFRRACKDCERSDRGLLKDTSRHTVGRTEETHEDT
jgi:hypothetical protein